MKKLKEDTKSHSKAQQVAAKGDFSLSHTSRVERRHDRSESQPVMCECDCLCDWSVFTGVRVFKVPPNRGAKEGHGCAGPAGGDGRSGIQDSHTLSLLTRQTLKNELFENLNDSLNFKTDL